MSKVLRFHSEGLERVARVIDGNQGYDDLLAHRLPEKEVAQFPAGLETVEARARAIALVEEGFRNWQPKTVLALHSGFVCDGKTHNNLQEFEFFERLCAPLGIEILNKNYATAKRYVCSHRAPELNQYLATVRSDVREFYEGRWGVTSSLVHQQMLYSKAFLGFVLAFTDRGAVLPSALVQANDHSPARVALSMVMKALGVPRIYLQHAEVASCFPPLDFEHSLLRNRKSLETYEDIGPVRGNTYILSRSMTDPNLDALGVPREGNCYVVIYPTSRVFFNALVDVVKRLMGNPHVSSLAIKLHPGAARSLQELHEQTGVTLLDTFPSKDHIAVVGNSAVAIELLRNGIPVYQYFGFDPVEADYYGFVGNRLTKEVAVDQLGGRFWDAYVLDERWKHEFSQWCPDKGSSEANAQLVLEAMKEIMAETTSPCYAEASARRTRRYLKRKTKSAGRSLIRRYPVLAKRIIGPLHAFIGRAHRVLTKANNLVADSGKPERGGDNLGVSGAVQEIQARAHDVGARKKNFAVFSISQVRDPIKWLVRAENVGVINPIILIDAADEVLQRHNNPIDCLPSAAIGPPWGSASQLYLYLRKKIRSNAQVNATDVEMVLAWLHSRPLDFHVRKRLLKVVLLLAMRGCLSRQLDRLLEHEVVEFEEMSLKHRFQVLRCYAYNGHWDKVSTRLEVMKAMATPFESLKLRNLEYLSGWIEGGWDHLEAERQFLALAPAGVAREFKSDVTPLYDAIRDRMRFMDIRSEGDNRSSLLSRIGQAIDSKEAFSCVRLGDREGYLFTECGYFSPGDVVACERHWWGERLEVAQRSKIVKEAKEAVANADLVGIPSIQRFIRDVSLKTDSLQDTLQFRGLVSVLMGIPSVVGASTMFTETYVNTGLFGDLGTISALARRADRLIIVASVKRERVPAILRAHGDFCYVTLPTHKNTDDSESYNKGDKKLPEVYERVIEDVEGVAKPGSLVLVAGGVIGKILVDRARAKGAVVIDLGHVIDEWIRGGGGNLR